MGNAYILIIDGLGVGAQEDAHLYSDEGMNTLLHVCESTGCKLPNFEKLGLGNIIDLPTIEAVQQPQAHWGKMRELSAGKDSTTGHWEIAGIELEEPFPTYPNGFPSEVLEPFCIYINKENILCNKPYSGTEVIADYGKEHLETGKPIVYTSADSVFQVAAHVDITTVDTLYDWCRFARENILTDENSHGVGRVIARPFEGIPGSFTRISEKRHDFSKVPPEHNLVQFLQKNDIKTYSLGKVVDLFGGRGFTQFRHTKSNAEGISQLLSFMHAGMQDCFMFVNLIDTDQLYGHRLDPEGYAESLKEIDRSIPALLSKLRDDDLFIITGDHGNDPCSDSTDHSREYVPLLVMNGGETGRDLGIRNGFSDVAVSVADYFNLKHDFPGISFI